MPFSSCSSSFILALCLTCLVAAGCGRMGKTLVDLSKLQAEIIKEYGDKGVEVNLNNSSSLIITFINSPLNAKAPEERAKRAEQTAAFVVQHYPSIDQIEEIWVSFVRAETHFIVVNYSEGIDVYAFDKNGRPRRRSGAEPTKNKFPNTMQPTAVYSPTLKQTDVLIERLQLEGNDNYGMSLMAHFTVPGDATGLRRSASYPQFVSFDFSSYSEKSLFPGEPKITALADGKVVFETSEQFSTSKSPDDGRFSEYLSLHIPYAAFRRMINGTSLKLKLGDREYDFTGQQIEALRGMTEYVKE